MKLSIYSVLIALAFLLFTNGCEVPGGSAEASLESRMDSVSYSLGFFYGQNLSSQSLDSVDMNNFTAGMQQALDGEESNIDQATTQMMMQEFQREIQQKQQAEQQASASENIEEGREFLEENAQKEDVMVTDSGLQYRVIEEGSGVSPTAEDEVEVHYRGTLLSGEEFDSSYSRNETTTFPLNRVIPGWTEGLQLMSEGATYEFFIPADLAYGNNPPPGSIIEPGSVLIFEVELIDVKE
jgi:FKBP-type peptidyl-prolyl cis-trans isomerase